ncbi:MAG: hypothetical protein ACK4P3_07610 [Fimbriimonadaceae bacterium]
MKELKVSIAALFAFGVGLALVGCGSGQTTQADIENQVTEIQKQDSGLPPVDPGDDMIMMGSGGKGGAPPPQPDQPAPADSPQ